MTTFITKGVPKLTKPEDICVGLTPGFKRCCLFTIRDGETHTLLISKKVSAELIAAGISYQG